MGITSQCLERSCRVGTASARRLDYRAPNMERCSRRGSSRLDGSHELLASGVSEHPVEPPMDFGSHPPGQWSSNPTQGKGSGKAMSYANTSRGKGMTSGKGLSSGKGRSIAKGGVQMLTSDQKAPQPVNKSGRKFGYCHSQVKDGNHDFLTCTLRNEGRDPDNTE